MKNGKVSRNVCKIIGCMLLGLIIVGPTLPKLHSQDSRAGRTAKKREITSIKPSSSPIETTPSSQQAPKRLQEIVLPDIFIALSKDHSQAQPKASASARNGADFPSAGSENY